MIQSGKFDSSNMNIKKLGNLVLIFIIKRLIEIFGIIILCLGVLLFISLASYSPTDPNYIFPENTEIKNLLGFQGSYVSDIFFQSIGVITYLIPITYIFTGLNIARRKELILLIENTFFIVLYSLIGSLFFSYYYENTYSFYINGNGGFIGSYLNLSFFSTRSRLFKFPSGLFPPGSFGFPHDGQRRRPARSRAFACFAAAPSRWPSGQSWPRIAVRTHRMCERWTSSTWSLRRPPRSLSQLRCFRTVRAETASSWWIRKTWNSLATEPRWPRTLPTHLFRWLPQCHSRGRLRS